MEIILQLCQSSLRRLILIEINKCMQTKDPPIFPIREGDQMCCVKMPSEVGLLGNCFIEN